MYNFDGGIDALSKHLMPKIIFVPDNIARALHLTQTPAEDLVDLEKIINLLGVAGVAMFVHLNDSYNNTSDIFSMTELLNGFDQYDLMDDYRDQLVKYPHLRDQYDTIVSKIDGYKDYPAVIPEDYLRPSSDFVGETIHYYVPKIMSLHDRTYMVRLEAVTGSCDVENASLRAIVANIGVLSKSYDIKQLASLPYFKEYVKHC